MEDLIDALFLWGFVQRVLPAGAAAGVVPEAVLRACRALGAKHHVILEKCRGLNVTVSILPSWLSKQIARV